MGLYWPIYTSNNQGLNTSDRVVCVCAEYFVLIIILVKMECFPSLRTVAEGVRLLFKCCSFFDHFLPVLWKSFFSVYLLCRCLSNDMCRLHSPRLYTCVCVCVCMCVYVCVYACVFVCVCV